MNFPLKANAYLPHTAPMVLIDEILKCEGDCLTAQTHLKQHTYIHENESLLNVPIYWSLEIAAQACACFIGLKFAEFNFSKGRLVKSKQLKFYRDYLPVEVPLMIHAKLSLQSEAGIFAFEGTLFETDPTSPLFKGDLTIYASE